MDDTHRHHTHRYEIRDAQLPHRPPLAYADTIAAARDTVDNLHTDYHRQLDANGEGCHEGSQELHVHDTQPHPGEPHIPLTSWIGAYH